MIRTDALCTHVHSDPPGTHRLVTHDSKTRPCLNRVRRIWTQSNLWTYAGLHSLPGFSYLEWSCINKGRVHVVDLMFIVPAKF